MNQVSSDILKQQTGVLKFGDQMHAGIEEGMSKGEPEFIAAETQNHHGHDVHYEGAFKQGNNKKVYFFNGFTASVYVPLVIVHPNEKLGPYHVLDAKTPEQGTFYVDSQLLEIHLLQDQVINEEKARGLTATIPSSQVSAEMISRDLHVLMTKEPELFSKMMARYNPEVNFDIDPVLKQGIAQLHASQFRSHYFSAGYGITAKQAANMLIYDIWVLKELGRSDQEKEPVYLKINNDEGRTKTNDFKRKPASNGYAPEKALLNFAFEEIMDPDPVKQAAKINDFAQLIKDGQLPLATPADKSLDQVLTGANPPYFTIQIYSLLTGAFLQHAPYKHPELNKGKDTSKGPGADEPIDPSISDRQYQARPATNDPDEQGEKKNSNTHASKRQEASRKSAKRGKGKGLSPS